MKLAKIINYVTAARDFDFDGRLDTILEKLQKLKAEHPTKTLFITKEYDYENSWYDITYIDEESDEDYKKRVNKVAADKRAATIAKKKAQEARDLAEYERLKAKFEGQ